ncbi:MAG: hypothetical protein FVQ77_14625 [Cytophagales bacterium]|nr:hypothetical protein [Cytophagales bacterium]
MKTLSNILLAAIFITCAFSSNFAIAQSNEVPFTQDDRDRLIRLEVQGEERHNSVQNQFNSVQNQFNSVQNQFNSLQNQIADLKSSLQKQIDYFQTFMLWGFGILFGGMGFLIGFVLWDRRTTLAPVIKENQAIKRVFLRLAENNTDVKEALKAEGIL